MTTPPHSEPQIIEVGGVVGEGERRARVEAPAMGEFGEREVEREKPRRGHLN